MNEGFFLGRTLEEVMAVANQVSIHTKPRLAGLDLLRFLAIVLVLGRHMKPCPEHWPPVLRSFLETWKRGGWVGVDLFFVLSGFLVSGLLFAEYKTHGRLSLTRFYVRRGWKIYPPFFAMIGTTLLVALARGHRIGRSRIFSESLFLQSYIAGLWDHTWSLSVEEHFYFLLPLLLAFLLMWNRGSMTPFRGIPAIAICLGTLLLIVRVLNYIYFDNQFSFRWHLFATHLRLDSLFFGVAISYAYIFHPLEFRSILHPRRRLLIVLGVVLLTPAFFMKLEASPIIYTVGLTVFYVGSGMLLVGVLLCRSRRTVSLPGRPRSELSRTPSTFGTCR